MREARKKCPDVIIVLGEDLTRFRNASKDNYNFLRSYSWNNKVERLGFDEVSVLLHYLQNGPDESPGKLAFVSAPVTVMCAN